MQQVPRKSMKASRAKSAFGPFRKPNIQASNISNINPKAEFDEYGFIKDQYGNIVN